MVRFEKDRYTIEIYTGGNPAEDYIGLLSELTFLLGQVNPETIYKDGVYQVCDLLYSMIPDRKTAKKMTE